MTGPHMTATTPHLLMSVSKSIVGCVAGSLVEDGLLSPDRPASSYVPEIAGSGYAGATVRHLLDMRTGERSESTLFGAAPNDKQFPLESIGRQDREVDALVGGQGGDGQIVVSGSLLDSEP